MAHSFTATWLCSNFKEDELGFVSQKNLYHFYLKECTRLKQKKPFPIKLLTKTFARIFPRSRKIERVLKSKSLIEAVVEGVSIYRQPPPHEQKILNIATIQNVLSEDAILLSRNDTSSNATIFLPSDIVVDGYVVMKEIILNFITKTWQLRIRDTDIVLSHYEISDEFNLTEDNFKVILHLVNSLDICTGVDVINNEFKENTEVLVETVDYNGNIKTEKRVRYRYVTCLQVLSWTHYANACRKCRPLKYQSLIGSKSKTPDTKPRKRTRKKPRTRQKKTEPKE